MLSEFIIRMIFACHSHLFGIAFYCSKILAIIDVMPLATSKITMPITAHVKVAFAIETFSTEPPDVINKRAAYKTIIVAMGEIINKRKLTI